MAISEEDLTTPTEEELAIIDERQKKMQEAVDAQLKEQEPTPMPSEKAKAARDFFNSVPRYPEPTE